MICKWPECIPFPVQRIFFEPCVGPREHYVSLAFRMPAILLLGGWHTGVSDGFCPFARSGLDGRLLAKICAMRKPDGADGG